MIRREEKAGKIEKILKLAFRIIFLATIFLLMNSAPLLVAVVCKMLGTNMGDLKLTGGMAMAIHNINIVMTTSILWLTSKKMRIRLPDKAEISKESLKSSVMLFIGFYPLMIGMNALSVFLTGTKPVAASGTFSQDMIPFIVLIAPICEEIAFRKHIYGYLEQFLSKNATIIIQAVLFGLYHGNFNQFCYTTVFAIMLGILRSQNGSFITGILVHIMLNSIGMLSVFFGKGEKAEIIQQYSPTYGIIALTMFVVGILLVKKHWTSFQNIAEVGD